MNKGGNGMKKMEAVEGAGEGEGDLHFTLELELCIWYIWLFRALDLEL